MRKIIYNFLIILILFGVIETGLHIAGFIIDNDKEDTEKKLYLLPQFAGKEWGKALFAENDELAGEYKDFRGWGKNEYHGNYININKDGVRKTWNPGNNDGKEEKVLYMFGPSAVWGFGARDDFTIPSYLSRELNIRGHAFRVFNYGEWGYSLDQQVIYLTKLLRDGHRPDYVIFYAWADFYNAYQAGKPGTLHFAFSIKNRMKVYTDTEHLSIGFKNMIRENLLIYKELKKILSRFSPPGPKFSEAGHKYSDDELRRLYDETIKYMGGSFNLVDSLSEAYGFKYLLFWPPITFTEEKLFNEELNCDERLHDERLKKFYSFTKEDFKTGLFPHFYNISDAFSGRTRPYYIDTAHTIEEGNDVISKKIASIFEKEYLQ